jgi:hypothetical protein
MEWSRGLTVCLEWRTAGLASQSTESGPAPDAMRREVSPREDRNQTVAGAFS